VQGHELVVQLGLKKLQARLKEFQPGQHRQHTAAHEHDE
jgi:hypothetical protein